MIVLSLVSGWNSGRSYPWWRSPLNSVRRWNYTDWKVSKIVVYYKSMCYKLFYKVYYYFIFCFVFYFSFQKIFPTAHTYPYHKFMEGQSYYNRLLDAWERRYSKRREDGEVLIFIGNQIHTIFFLDHSNCHILQATALLPFIRKVLAQNNCIC